MTRMMDGGSKTAHKHWHANCSKIIHLSISMWTGCLNLSMMHSVFSSLSHMFLRIFRRIFHPKVEAFLTIHMPPIVIRGTGRRLSAAAGDLGAAIGAQLGIRPTTPGETSDVSLPGSVPDGAWADSGCARLGGSSFTGRSWVQVLLKLRRFSFGLSFLCSGCEALPLYEWIQSKSLATQELNFHVENRRHWTRGSI